MNWDLKPLLRVAVHVVLMAMDLYCSTRPRKPKGIPMPDLWR